MSTYATEIPGAPGYAQSAALANRAYKLALGRFNQQRSSTLLRYGYNRDASGNLSVDPNNEAGQYQQMLRGEAGQVDRLDRAQAGSGWDTSSGYLGQQRENLSHDQGIEQTNLGRSLTDELSGIDLGEQQAKLDEDSALYQAQLDAARNAVQNQDFNPADYSGLDAATYGEEPPAAAKPAPAKGVPKKVSAAAQAKAKQQMIAKVRARKKKGGR